MAMKDIQEAREYLVLLLLGTSEEDKHSLLQIQKEFYYLWRSSEKIRPLIRFIAHYRGPYSEGLQDTIMNPMFLENLWDYIPPNPRDRLTGGFIKINQNGKKEFRYFMDQIKKNKNNELIQIISGMRLLHDLYDNLSTEEFLFLVYVNPDNKDFIKRSEIYDKIVTSNIKEKLYIKLKESNPDFFEMEGLSIG